jgi:hypothetical protein
MTIEFIPAKWLEFALYNRPMVVYSRPVELPAHSATPQRRKSDYVANLLQAALADFITSSNGD